jgi:hypothetical protein
VEAGELVAATVGEGETVGEAVTAVGVALGVTAAGVHAARIRAAAMRNRLTA